MVGIIPLPDAVGYALSRLKCAGHQAVIVGGCVRDVLLQKSPEDFDIATSAKPRETMAVFAGEKLIETGIKHGTVALVRDGMMVEITTFRIDGAYSDGRHPDQVVFTPNLRDDVLRRDFTINALAYDAEIGVIDEVNGIADLTRRIVRAVGNPSARFSEDALRILRALRFSSVLEFQIEAETEKAIHALKDSLSRIARERIQVELMKLMSGGNAGGVLSAFRDVMETVAPAVGGIDDETYARAAVSVDALPREALLRLSAYLLPLRAEEKRSTLRGLKMSREAIDSVMTLDWAIAQPRSTRLEIKRILARTGYAVFDDAMRILSAWGMDVYAAMDEARNIKSAGCCLTLRDMQVNGGDAIAMGIPPGARVGEVLCHLLEMILAEKLPNEHDVLCGEIRKLL